MAGRPRSSPIHRAKSTMCEDLAIILGPTCLALSEGAKYAVIDQALALWSAHEGKLEGCRYWTRDAIFARREHLRYNGSGLPIQLVHQLVHEHIVPRNVIRTALLALPSPTATDIHALLDRYCVAAVITRPQDARLTALGLRSAMPHGWRFGNRWARYSHAAIEILDRDDDDAIVDLQG